MTQPRRRRFEVTLATRPVPRCESFPRGLPSEVVTALYEEHEMEYVSALRTRLDGGDVAAAQELAAFHELKSRFDGGRLLRPTEQARWEETHTWVRERPGEAAKRRQPVAGQTTLVPPPGTASLFEPPKRAKKAEEVERDNAAEYDPNALNDPASSRTFITDPDKTPATQRKAAMSALPRSGSDKLRVLLFLYEEEGRGATDEEIAAELRLPLNTARPRRYDLAKEEWIVESGRTRKTVTGSDAAVWVLSEKGRINFDQLRARRSDRDRSRAV